MKLVFAAIKIQVFNHIYAYTSFCMQPAIWETSCYKFTVVTTDKKIALCTETWDPVIMFNSFIQKLLFKWECEKNNKNKNNSNNNERSNTGIRIGTQSYLNSHSNYSIRNRKIECEWNSRPIYPKSIHAAMRTQRITFKTWENWKWTVVRYCAFWNSDAQVKGLTNW